MHLTLEALIILFADLMLTQTSPQYLDLRKPVLGESPTGLSGRRNFLPTHRGSQQDVNKLKTAGLRSTARIYSRAVI
jgi:hypothetical protein